MPFEGSTLIRLLVILCALTISTAIHAAEKRQTGNIIYEPPKDWRVGSGVRGFDVEEAILTETSKAGNYRHRGNKIVLNFADGETDTLKLKGDAMQDGNAHLSKVRLAEDGFRFEGTLSNFTYSPFGAGISGGIATSSKREFYKDGTYESDSFFSASGDFDSGGGFTSTKDAGAKRGRYEIADGLIRLTPPDGNEIVWPFDLSDVGDEDRIAIRGEYLD